MPETISRTRDEQLQAVIRTMRLLNWEPKAGIDREHPDGLRTWITAEYSGLRRLMPNPNELQAAMSDEAGALPDGCTISQSEESGFTVVDFVSPPGDLETFANRFLRYAGVQLLDQPS
jgi:hypothetical protein